MSGEYYRLFDHTADLGMEIFGGSVEELFSNAGHALFHIMVGENIRQSEAHHQHQIDVEGADWPDLMVNWLRELLYLWSGKLQIVDQIDITSLCETRLYATVTSIDFDPAKHRIDKEIKAITYHQIEVVPDAKGWRASVIFDV